MAQTHQQLLICDDLADSCGDSTLQELICCSERNLNPDQSKISFICRATEPGSTKIVANILAHTTRWFFSYLASSILRLSR